MDYEYLFLTKERGSEYTAIVILLVEFNIALCAGDCFSTGTT